MNKYYIKNALTGIYLSISVSLVAQTGNVSMNLSGALSTNPAILDLSDASNAHLGFLMPNINLQSVTDAATIPSPTTGMIVWNTNNSMPFGAGYYYWSGSQWNFIYNSGSNLTNSILNQNASQQTANFWISGPASIGTANVSTTMLEVSTTGSADIGVEGDNLTGNNGAGVIGTSSSISYADYNPLSSGLGVGIFGLGSYIGIVGTYNESGGAAIYGAGYGGTNPNAAIANGDDDYGVFGNYGGTTGGAGVAGYAGNVSATTGKSGVMGAANVSGDYGIWGLNQVAGSYGVAATNSTGVTGKGLYVNGVTDLIGNLGTINNVSYSWPSAEAASNGQVLTSSTAGVLSWATPPIVSANNGLAITSNNVQLGGNLTTATTITNNGNALTFAGSSVNTTIASTGQVGIGTSSPNASAALVVASTTQGVLLPSLNATQAATLAASNPAVGLIIFNNSINCYEFFAGGAWQLLACGCTTAPASFSISGSTSPPNNSTSTYTAVVTGATTYTWSSSNTNLASISSGQGTPVVTVATTATTGTYTLTLVCGNSCGTTSGSLSITSLGIEKDATGESTSNPNFTITTTHANDLVLVSCNGYSTTGPWNGSVSISGGGNPTATLFQSYASPNYYALIAVYYFVAPTAATYTVTITEGSNVAGFNYSNFGVALTGFSGTPSGADLVSFNEAELGTGGTSLGATLTESAGSYAFGTASNYVASVPNSISWTGITTLSAYTPEFDDFGTGGTTVSNAGTPTITANDPGGFAQGIIMLIDVH